MASATRPRRPPLGGVGWTAGSRGTLGVSGRQLFAREPSPIAHRTPLALPRADRAAPVGLRAPGPDQRSSGHHGRQPAAELPAARPGRLHAAPRPAAVLEPVHLQRHPVDGRFNAGAFYPLVGLFVASPTGPPGSPPKSSSSPASPSACTSSCGRSKLSTIACVLAAATFAFAGPVLSQVNHVDMTEGFLGHPLDAPGCAPHRARRAVALVHPARDRLFERHPGGAPEAMLDEALSSWRSPPCRPGLSRERWWRVLSCADGRRAGPVPGGDPVAARDSRRFGIRNGAAEWSPPPGVSRRPSASCVCALHRRWIRTSGGGRVLRPVQPARGRVYLGILPLVALVTLLRPRWPSRIAPRDRLDLVRRRACSATCWRWAPTRPGASVQQPAPLRPSAAAEPQHDHGGHRGLCPVRRLDRSLRAPADR